MKAAADFKEFSFLTNQLSNEDMIRVKGGDYPPDPAGPNIGPVYK